MQDELDKFADEINARGQRAIQEALRDPMHDRGRGYPFPKANRTTQYRITPTTPLRASFRELPSGALEFEWFEVDDSLVTTWTATMDASQWPKFRQALRDELAKHP